MASLPPAPKTKIPTSAFYEALQAMEAPLTPLNDKSFDEWLKNNRPTSVEQLSEYTDQEKADYARALQRWAYRLERDYKGTIDKPGKKVKVIIPEVLKGILATIEKAEDSAGLSSLWRSATHWVTSVRIVDPFVPDYVKPERFKKEDADASVGRGGPAAPKP